MRKLLGIAAPLALAITAGSASAAVQFTFADPSSAQEFTYTAPAMAGESGTLSYNDTVDLTVFGDVNTTYAGSIFTFTGDVGSVTTFGSLRFASVTNGSFTFNYLGEDILTGTFNDALLAINVNVGGISTSVNAGDLALTAGGQFLTDLVAAVPQAVGLGAPHDASWTLTNLSQTAIIDVGGEDFFDSFNADSAFTATSGVIIPTPATAVLGLFGLGMMTRRRG